MIPGSMQDTVAKWSTETSTPIAPNPMRAQQFAGVDPVFNQAMTNTAMPPNTQPIAQAPSLLGQKANPISPLGSSPLFPKRKPLSSNATESMFAQAKQAGEDGITVRGKNGEIAYSDTSGGFFSSY